MNKKIIKINHITKIYGQGEGQTIALNDVSMDVYNGEFLVIVGNSGSGKSTLLNIIGGIDSLNSGTIVINDKTTSLMNDEELTKFRKEKIGFVFQSFNLINELTAFENVALVFDNKQIVIEALETVGLAQKINSYPSELSGGQQQRVSIARAIVNKPDILLCDEPTGALDYETGRSILLELEKICREYKKTIIFVTHTREIGKMADRVIEIKNGKIEKIKINKKPAKAKDIEW